MSAAVPRELRWMRRGALVNYHSLIDGPVTLETAIREEPWLLGGHTWVVMVDRKSGAVACDAISPRQGPQP